MYRLSTKRNENNESTTIRQVDAVRNSELGLTLRTEALNERKPTHCVFWRSKIWG